MSTTKSDDVDESAMGFKDKQKALDTLKALDGRDPSYQYRVIAIFISRAKRAIQITKNEEKIANIREAQQVFEDWVNDYKKNNRGKENYAYLPLQTIRGFRALAKEYNVLDDSFYLAYKRMKGYYKALRNVKIPDGSTTWDIARNKQLKTIVEKMKTQHEQWYETDVGKFRGLPTIEHVRCIQLGYSPDPTKLRKLIAQVEQDFEGADEPEEMEMEDEKGEKLGKRRRNDSSDSDEDSDEPETKSARKDEDVGKARVNPKEKTNAKEEKEEGGLSFKSKEHAVTSLKSLEGRDVAYQYHAITGLLRRAERVLTITKDQEKIKNMKEAVEVYENWITDYNVNGRSKENFAYLPLDVVQAYTPLANKYGIADNGFSKAYEKVDGDYKKLRGVEVPESNVTWDIERNKHLREIVDKIKEERIQWFETDPEFRGLPTKEHTRCIMWGFSHDTTKIKKLIPTLKDKLELSSE